MSRARDIASGADFSTGIDAGEVVPHIIPGVLYPAVANIMVDGSTALSAVTTGPNGSTVASSKYGTVQSDGRMYYYTDIKGSKPIKDPRIGAHFGSQRYRTTSLQLLEQETATHGYNVYTVDGRDYMRASAGTADWQVTNNAGGTHLTLTAASSNTVPEFIEIVAYANMCNFQTLGNASGGNSFERFDVYVDGTLTFDDPASAPIAVSSPLLSRYVIGGSTRSAISSGVTLGLHTFKFQIAPPWTGSAYMYLSAIELIAQDTTSTANKSKIQIPSQNVVSYGKKFTVSGTPHYNPFAFKTDGTTAWTSGSHNGTSWPVGTGSSANIDTATSIGLANWLHSSNYYKPYNGGRVVVWAASDGTIKTSVNVMPPNARSVGNSASLSNATAKANASIANNTFYPTMEAGAIDHSLSEVAKTFHWREFGNGSANEGPPSGTTYADASMQNTTNDDVAYVMDDGLSSLAYDTWQAHTSGTHTGSLLAGTTSACYITFIGTGISINFSTDSTGADSRTTIAQNLPYGSHVLKILYHTGGSNDLFVDGIQVEAAGADTIVRIKNDITFHQPKMPPIPEDACILADYMLMADFVPITAVDLEHTLVSKGCRRLSPSRDFLMDDNGSNSLSFAHFHGDIHSHAINAGSVAADELLYAQIPTFCTNFVSLTYQNQTRHDIYLDGVHKPHGSGSTQDNSTSWGTFGHLTTDTTLGLHTVRFQDSDTNWNLAEVDIATPIHTSSHYQSFETPYLHELVGGDRNMEQNNLIVTPDGKSWNDVTRNTSYLGNVVLSVYPDNTHTNMGYIRCDVTRGSVGSRHFFNKDFAIAFDAWVCLKDGWYEFYARVHLGDTINTSDYFRWEVNGSTIGQSYQQDADRPGPMMTSATAFLKRNDKVQLYGATANNNVGAQDFRILRLK